MLLRSSIFKTKKGVIHSHILIFWGLYFSLCFEILTSISSSRAYFELVQPLVCWCSGTVRAVQDDNQPTDGPLTSPYVIRLFSRGFQKISHLLLIILPTAQCIRVIGSGTDLSCMHLFFILRLTETSSYRITKENWKRCTRVSADRVVGVVKLVSQKDNSKTLSEISNRKGQSFVS